MDAGKRVEPAKLGDYIEGYFREPEKISNKLQTSIVESCYLPIFSSAPRLPADLTKYDPAGQTLDFSVIVCSVGARYRSVSVCKCVCAGIALLTRSSCART